MIKDKLDTRKLKAETSYRELSFTREAVNVDTRTIQVAFASETPYEHWWGVEILDCGADSIRLGRLMNKAALLFNHDTDELIGVVENVSLGNDRICRATVRFGKGENAEEHFQNVLDGILTKVSVGYRIHKMVLEKETDAESTYRITDWEPFEISMVSIAADDNVGLGRSHKTGGTEPPAKPEATPPIIIQEQKKMEKTVEQLAAEAEEQARKYNERELDTKRREVLVDIGVKYADYLTMQDVQEACTKGHTPQQLQELVIDRQKTKHSDTRGQHVGLSEKEVGQYSIARMVSAMLSGDFKHAGLERAASEAAAQKFGSAHNGRTFSLPFDVMAKRDFTVATAAEAGNLVATDLRADMFADVLRNRLALGQLGTTMLFGLTSNIDLPRKTVGASVGFLTEIAAAAESQPNTGKVSLAPKRIGSFVQFSKQAVIQSAMAVEPLLRQDIISELNTQIEYQAINGSAAGAYPRGIRNVSGIGSVVGGTNGGQVAWSHIVGLESAVANVNAEPDVNAGYLINTKTRGWTKQTLKAAALPFIWDNGAQPLNGYRAAVTNNVLSNLVKGTSGAVCSSLIYSSMWDMLVIGMFGAVELTLDEVTQATNGMNQLILNAYVDVGCRRPANFSVMDDALTA